MRIIFVLINCMVFSLLTQAQVEKVILFTIDGLHWEAPERLNMPAFNALIDHGTYAKESYMIIPHHPTIGDYSKVNSCSFPNPVLHEGTLFLSSENKMVQELFSPELQTAFIVNTTAYKSVGRGFSTLIMDNTFSDAEVVDCAINILKTQNPVFTRIHLQIPGRRGYEISQSTPDKPYYRNIFAPESTYLQAIENADKQLGRFVAFLKETGMWNEVILIVTSDHGQSLIGWHPLFEEDSWKTPLVFAGGGIVKGRKLDYFEHTDLAPTIAGLLSKKWQTNNGSEGVCQKELLEKANIDGYQPKTYIKKLNEQIKEYNLLKSKFILLSEKDGHFANIVALLDNQTFIEPFYHQDRILEWKKAGTIEHMLEVNENVLTIMRNELPK